MADTLKITAITPYKGRTLRVDFEQGDPAFLNADIVTQFSLRAGMVLPLSAWEQVQSEALYRKARERALYLLDVRDYGYVEMYKKLDSKYGEDIAFRVMDFLVEHGSINDMRYAEGLARHYVEVKGFGRFRAFREMRAKGLTAEVVNAALDQYDDEFWYDRLRQLVEKKYLRCLEDEKGIEKVKNALARYGYSFTLVKEVLRDILEEYSEEE